MTAASAGARSIRLLVSGRRFRKAMTARAKKLVGTFAMLIWIPVYALVAMGIAVHVLPHAPWFVALLYYALAGTLWIVPIGLMLPWMHREAG
jgi:ABC-type proline/glycine betaine transport system permease subunit